MKSAKTQPPSSKSQAKQDNGFGPLLRSWRERRKYSQLALSLEASVSQRHLSFMESGRSKPSREMILQLAEVLDVPLRERNLLLSAAGFATVYQARQLHSDEMAAVRQALEITLKHHEPFPALVMDKEWNMLMQNKATERFIGLLGNPDDVWQNVDPSGKRNAMRLTFHEKGMQPLIKNWNEAAGLLLSRLQREINAYPTHRALADLFEGLCALPATPTEWQTQPITHAPEPLLSLEVGFNGLTLKIFSMVTTFGTALDVTADELRIETFFPADEFSRQFFESLRGQL